MKAGKVTRNLLSKHTKNILAISQYGKEKFFMHLLKMATGNPSTLHFLRMLQFTTYFKLHYLFHICKSLLTELKCTVWTV